MEINVGIHKKHNEFPHVFRYIIPRLLNGVTRDIGDVRIYKWMWFYLSIGGNR